MDESTPGADSTRTVVELHLGPDARVYVDGGPDEVPILTVVGLRVEVLIRPGTEQTVTTADVEFAAALVEAAPVYRDALIRRLP